MANLNLSEFTEKLFVTDADHTFIWDTQNAISKRVSRNSWLNSGTLTSDAPVTISQTWNQIGTAFTALKVNAVSTASATGSLLLDLQLGGATKFKVDKASVATLGVSAGADNSALYFGGANYSISLTRHATGLDMGVGGDNRISFGLGVGQILLSGRSSLAWSDGNVTNTGTVDTILLRDGAANTLALRNSTAAQMFRVYGTYSDGTNYRRLAIGSFNNSEFDIQTEGAGGGTGGGPLNFGTAGARRMTITTAGNVGIGTTNPTTPLSIKASNGGDVLNVIGQGSYANFLFQVGGVYGANLLSVANTSTDGFLIGTDVFSTDTGCVFRMQTKGVTRAVIDRNGNLGIGTTSPTSKLHVAETWNNAGTAFCAIKSVITDTNSAAGSDFLELYSGTSTQPLRVDINKTGQINIYGAWTDASNYERLSFNAPSAANAVIGTNKAGTGTARGLEFQTDGVKRIEIQPGGNSIISNTLTVGGNINVGYLLKLASLTVSTLPAASGSSFPTLVGVTDSTVTAAAGKGNTVVGGGSNKVIVMSDGTNWVIL